LMTERGELLTPLITLIRSRLFVIYQTSRYAENAAF
jgi:hypothetical protein